jgi:hypothetical protein
MAILKPSRAILKFAVFALVAVATEVVSIFAEVILVVISISIYYGNSLICIATPLPGAVVKVKVVLEIV